MQDIEDKFKLMWKKYDDLSWTFIETGELHNDLQRKGIIKSILDNDQIKNFHENGDLYLKYDVPNDRKVINKKNKKNPETTLIPWKDDPKKDLFIKVYRGEGVELIMNQILDIFEKGFMFTIQSFVEYKTNCIIIDGDFPTVEYLAELSGMSPRKANDIVKSLEKKNIIKRYKDGLHKKIFVNPHYMCAGSKIEGEIPSFFIVQIEDVDDSTLEMFDR